MPSFRAALLNKRAAFYGHDYLTRQNRVSSFEFRVSSFRRPMYDVVNKALNSEPVT
ncbi:hypothetical protein GCM10007086_41960 [Photobacterium aphoticum]|nr:hypothetical protein GCM10007086_41960 [Photobacterium aphoticum]